MTRPRDTQRNKVEDALRSIEQGGTLNTFAEVHRYAGRVTRSKWWETNCNGAIRSILKRDDGVLSHPRPPVTELMVLKRLAHYAAPQDKAWHSVEWTQVFLSIVGRFMGVAKRNEVRAAFKAHKVKTTQWSPEAREAAKRRRAQQDLLGMMKDLGGSGEL